MPKKIASAFGFCMVRKHGRSDSRCTDGKNRYHRSSRRRKISAACGGTRPHLQGIRHGNRNERSVADAGRLPRKRQSARFRAFKIMRKSGCFCCYGVGQPRSSTRRSFHLCGRTDQGDRLPPRIGRQLFGRPLSRFTEFPQGRTRAKIAAYNLNRISK